MTMDKISAFFEYLYSSLAAVPFGLLITIALGSAGGLMVLFVLFCALSQRLRAADKRPVFHFVNAFTAVFLALMLIQEEANRALFAAALFWLAGYLYYGALCALTRRSAAGATRSVNALSVVPVKSPAREERISAPAADSGVRLDHALAIADKLLLKQLARADRQELEKIKTTLTVIQIKGNPTPQESEIINDHFNTLLKLMAKYEY